MAVWAIHDFHFQGSDDKSKPVPPTKDVKGTGEKMEEQKPASKNVVAKANDAEKEKDKTSSDKKENNSKR